MNSLCCISLNLKEEKNIGFQTMTYKRFSSLPREKSLKILGDRIENNLNVTKEIILYCDENKWNYRMSSDLFPLITYDKANVSLEDLPNYNEIENSLDKLKETVQKTKVRISCHPSEYNSLASLNEKVVAKTIQELNFYSSFMDRIDCPKNHCSPMNLHVHNNNGTREEISNRFLDNFNNLSESCRSRLVIENDDKLNCWGVKDLTDIFHPITNIPITYDSHHFRIHDQGLSPKQAIKKCIETWDEKPLFHFSNGRDFPLHRAHSDFVQDVHEELFDNEVDIDFEFKAKDKCILKFEKSLL